jgi:zinc transport system permease protein
MMDILAAGFVRNALAASLLIALILSVLGLYVVVRRIIFLGAALAQVSAAGVALASFAAGALTVSHPGLAEELRHHPELVAIAATLLGALALGIRPTKVALPSEGVIGLGYALASTLAILIVARTPGAEGDTLLLLYGNILAVRPVELLELSILCPVTLALTALFRKEFLAASLQPEMAMAAGARVGLWNLLLYALLGFGIATGINVAGSLLTFAYLVVPALAGLLVGRRSWHVTAVAIAVAVVGTLGGILASVAWDLPSGPAVVAVLVLETAVAWGIARLMG